MRIFYIFIWSFCLPLFLSLTAHGEMPAGEASKVWEYITNDLNYKKWNFWPDHKGFQKGRAPHGKLHRIFVNNRGLISKSTPVKYGTIIVKENFSLEKELKAITIMYKIKGFNPASGDWFWAKYSPNGNVLISGKPSGCIACHGAVKRKDYIFVHDLHRI